MSGTDPAPPAAPPSTLAEAMRGKDWRYRVRARGEGAFSLDLYHRLMRASPSGWAMSALLGFLAFNLTFAWLYMLDPHGLSAPADQAGIGPFWRAFFFSVHTVATVGYGNVYPVSFWANMVVVVEITSGLSFFAVITGLAFARFSRPRARILFSEVAVVRDAGEERLLMLRAANQRHNMIFAAEARLSVLVEEVVAGITMRRFRELDLVRASNPTFALSWTIMHRIDASSPLGPLLDAGTSFEIIALVSGTDEVSGQTIHGRWAYAAADLRSNARFVDILERGDDQLWTIDYDKFHLVVEEP
ncbi:MAG: ATP-sensitive inward rectifier potassium channel 10 [Proteobacteria bacterium]|nr:ATP-sensitive inward rectifier potassium channel 10 [Pseudomonadota bacterium]